MHLREEFIRQAVPGVSFLYSTFSPSMSFSIDSRTLKKDDIFIALVGGKCDGHDFVADVLKKGAAGCIIDEKKKQCLKNIDSELLKNKLVMLVPDPRTALIQLAMAWRAQFTYPVIAITGSIGKTSTKQILCNILDVHGMPYVASSGNYNTILGLSLTLLKMNAEHKVAIVELGINRRGEMAQLVQVAKPTAAVITAIGHSHMEGLGSIIDIAAEKRDIFKLFKEDNIGIVNGDQALLANVGYNHPVIKFGAKTTNQVQARKIKIESDQASFVLKLYGDKYNVTLKNNHSGAIFNALAAITVAYMLKIPATTIFEGLKIPLTISGRFEQKMLKSGKGIIINDCYNASPESMKAALLALQNIKTKAQKIVVLGDMLELGVNSPFWHRQLGRFLRKVPSVRQVILVGSMVEWTKKTVPVGVHVDVVPSWQEAISALQNKLSQDSVVLVKGSRGMALNNLVTAMI